MREGLFQYNLGVRIMSVFLFTETLFRSESARDWGQDFGAGDISLGRKTL